MRLKLFTAALFAFGLAAHAATITYTQTVTASGSLNNVAFNNALLTMQATVDSDTIMIRPNRPTYVAPTLTFGGSVAGLGAFSLGTGLVFDNQQAGIVGFNSGGSDIFDISNTFFSTYDLKSSTPLITGTTDYLVSTSTSSGFLLISTYSRTSTFQAQAASIAVTPEPSSFALLATGLAGIGGLLRKRLI